MRIGLALLLASGIAHADIDGEMTEMIEGLPMRSTDKDNPQFSFTNNDAYWAGKDSFGNQPNFMGSGVDISNLVSVTSADGKAAWFAADVKGVPQDGDCAPGPCAPNRDPPLHVTGLVEKSGKTWKWVAWHVAPPLTAKDQAALAKQKTLPDTLPRETKGADDVAKLVAGVLADPNAFTALVADRKDVVLYGSAGPERYLGAKAKKQLAAWNLKLAVRDGVRAGMVGSNVAWFAANVDATNFKKANAPADPYRMLLVLEKTGAAWKIVQLHFSVDIFTYTKP